MKMPSRTEERVDFESLNSLDRIEALMLLEEVFGADILDDGEESFQSLDELVNRFLLYLSNQRPNDEAVKLLKRLAKSNNDPALAEGLDGLWRREQIAAITSYIFHK